MNRIVMFTTSAAVAFVLVLYLWSEQPQLHTRQNSAALSRMNIELSLPKTKPKLTQQQAKAITDKISSYDAIKARQVIVEYQLVTQTDRPDPLHRVPCYIVSYEGLHDPSHQGVPGGTIAPPHTEINFIIDANMGKLLFSFSYR